MPLPKQLSAWNDVLKETLAKGRAKFGAKKYSLKRGMKDASKIYKKMKGGKTAKKRGGAALSPTKLTIGGAEEDKKEMAGGDEEERIEGGAEGEEEKPVSMGGKKSRSKKSKA